MKREYSKKATAYAENRRMTLAMTKTGLINDQGLRIGSFAYREEQQR
jgi:hypothetical protein